jgi:hypothetical protein
VNRNDIDIPDEITVSAEHQSALLAMDTDTMHVNKVPFLTTVARHILYRTATPLVATGEALRSAVKQGCSSLQ